MESDLVDLMPITEQVFPQYCPNTNHPHILSVLGVRVRFWAEFILGISSPHRGVIPRPGNYGCVSNPKLPLVLSNNVS